MSAPQESINPALAELISAYLDDALSADERGQVEAALRDDPAAARYLAELRNLRGVLAALPRESAGPSFVTDLKRRMLADGSINRQSGGGANPAPEAAKVIQLPTRETAAKVHSISAKSRSPLWIAAALIVGVAGLTLALPRLFGPQDQGPDYSANTKSLVSMSEKSDKSESKSAKAGEELPEHLELSSAEMLDLVGEQDFDVSNEFLSLSIDDALLRTASLSKSFSNSLSVRTISEASLNEENFSINALAAIEAPTFPLPAEVQRHNARGAMGGGGGGSAGGSARGGIESIEKKNDGEKGADKIAPQKNSIEKNELAKAATEPANARPADEKPAGIKSDDKDAAANATDAVEAIFEENAKENAQESAFETQASPVLGLLLDGDIEEVALALANMGFTTISPNAATAKPASARSEMKEARQPETGAAPNAPIEEEAAAPKESEQSRKANEKSGAPDQGEDDSLANRLRRLNGIAQSHQRRQNDGADVWGDSAPAPANAAKESSKALEDSDREGGPAETDSLRGNSEDDRARREGPEELKGEKPNDERMKDDAAKKYDAKSENVKSKPAGDPAAPKAKTNDIEALTENLSKDPVVELEALRQSAAYRRILAELQAMLANKKVLEVLESPAEHRDSARDDDASDKNADEQSNPRRVRIVIPVSR